MPDEIKERLQKSSETCVQSYEAWRKDEKSLPARESLQEAIHELRKVASRLEIELAISERDQMAQKPIPIPPHRNANKGRNKDNRDGGKKPSKKSDSKKPDAKKSDDKKEESANDKAPKDGKKAAGGEN